MGENMDIEITHVEIKNGRVIKRKFTKEEVEEWKKTHIKSVIPQKQDKKNE